MTPTHATPAPSAPGALDAPEPFDALVVGGSWAGLAAAMQLARARRRVLVVDAGRPRNRFAESAHGFLGQDGRAPADILETARAQVLAYPTARLVTDEATRAERRADGGFDVALASGGTVRARRLVLATGVVDELSPAVPGLAERWGRTVLHCPYCHGYEVRDRRLGVLAAGEGNLHQALLLPDWSADVTLFPNGAVALDDEQRAALARRGVRVDERRVVALVGAAPGLEAVRVADDAGEAVVPLDALFTGSRVRPATPLAEQLGCEHEEGPLGVLVRADAQRATTVPGVFAAGDVARQPHAATFAAADGVMAGIAAHRSLVMG